MKRIRLIVITIIIAVAIISLAAWMGREKPVAVIVKTAAIGKVQETVTNTRAGTIEACRRSGISPSIGGQISELPVKEGDIVKSGQILMQLWNEDIQAQYDLARIESRAAAARANQACVKAEVVKREAGRLKKLQIKKLSSEEAVDKVDGEARAQQAACDAGSPRVIGKPD